MNLFYSLPDDLIEKIFKIRDEEQDKIYKERFDKMKCEFITIALWLEINDDEVVCAITGRLEYIFYAPNRKQFNLEQMMKEFTSQIKIYKKLNRSNYDAIMERVNRNIYP
jgi:hypothetical protein